MRLDAADPVDELFLYELFAETRRRELSVTGLQKAELETLLQMQYRARERSYSAAYPDSVLSVARMDGRPVGVVRVNTGPTAITLIDIVVHIAERNRGIGSALLQRLLRDAQAAIKPVVLRVDNGNEAALRLYRRHGFVCTAIRELYSEMRWNPVEDSSSESGNEGGEIYSGTDSGSV